MYWPIVGLIFGSGAILAASLLMGSLVFVTSSIGRPWRKRWFTWTLAFLIMDTTFRWHDIKALYMTGIPAGLTGLGIGYEFYCILKAFLDRAWILILVRGIAMLLGHSIFVQFVKNSANGLVHYPFGSINGIYSVEITLGVGHNGRCMG
ncbi:hypothetical protein ACP8Y2_02295 [Herpetosiphon llansteffanensis]